MTPERMLSAGSRRAAVFVVLCLIAPAGFRSAPAAPAEDSAKNGIAQLASEDVSERQEARRALVEIGKPAVPALLALAANDESLRGEALAILDTIAEVSREAAPRLREIAEAEADTADPKEIAALIETLELPWNVKGERKQQVAEAIARLGVIGTPAIEPAMKAFNRGNQSFVFRHRLVQALEAMASPESRTALLDVALGRTRAELPSMKRWASRAYVATLEDKAEARKLLDSDDGGVLNNALLAMKGQPIDQPILRRLQELIRSAGGEPNQDMTLRWCAAGVMGEAPNPEHAKEKVAAIVGAIADVQGMPRGEETYWPGYFTYEEATYRRYINALVAMQGAEETLQKIADGLNGRQRQCVMIARAERGDHGVAGEIRAIAKDPGAGLLRAWAVRSLGRIGDEKDKAMLRDLAQNDPLHRDVGGCMPPDREGTNWIYPVRTAAAEALESIAGM